MLLKSRKPLAPSTSAASMISSGTALIAADNTHHGEAGLDPDHDDHQQEVVQRMAQEPVRRMLPAQGNDDWLSSRPEAATIRGSRRRTSR